MKDDNLELFVHTPQLTEVGGFDGIVRAPSRGIAATNALIRSRYAIATTVPGQRFVYPALQENGWRLAGVRYNRLHGPNMIRLWMRDFGVGQPGAIPERDEKGVLTSYGWIGGGMKFGFHNYPPPNSAFCCGLWVATCDFAELSAALIHTNWLALWAGPTWPGERGELSLRNAGWTALAPTLWTTARSHAAAYDELTKEDREIARA